MLDITRIRADTPGCESVAHLNNAGSSLPPRQVVDASVDYLRTEQLMGGYEAAESEVERLDAVYASAARLLNCNQHEVAFTTGASDAWWRAFSAIPLAPGDRVLIGRSEFMANAFGLLQARDRGVQVEVVPNTAAGEIDVDAMADMLDDRVKLIAHTQISMSNGAIHPSAAVGALAKEAGVLYLLDSCQAAGQLVLDVEALGCDFLVFTGRKFLRAPRGTGVLYARTSALERLGPSPFVDGRSAVWTSEDTYEPMPYARRFEFGEQNFAGKIGLGVAIEYAMEIGLDPITERITILAGELRQQLSSIQGAVVRDEGKNQCGIVTFTVDGHEAIDVQRELRKSGVNVSAPNRQNAQLDIGHRGIEAVVRAGVHYFNTPEETAKLVEVVAALLN